ncbi:hypothetical protein Tco_0317999 [Tanacetum coccineum]
MEEPPYRQFRGDRHRAIFQTDDLDSFDSASDDVPSARAVLMATLSSYDSDVLSEVALNKLSEHFVKHFVPQKQLSAEQEFWLPISQPVSKKQPIPSKPVLKKEIPRKLPPISLDFFIINELQAQLEAKNVSIMKLKEHIANLKGKNTVEVFKMCIVIKAFCVECEFELICATFHKCMFDAIHDLCVCDYLVDVNARVKSQSVKSRNAKNKKKKMWKPTGKMYTNVRYRWKPIGQLFTIDGNTCPLTRIISTKVVPPRKSNLTTLVKQIQPSSNKSGKLKDITNVESSSKSKTIASDEEIEGLMKDQPLSTDASPTALSPGYIANFDLEEDKEDPEEDPADHPADG